MRNNLLKLNIIGIFILVLIGTLGFMVIEHLSFMDGLWMTMMSVLTVGYGDIVPKTPSGKLFAMILIPLSFSLFTMIVGQIAAEIISRQSFIKEKRMLKKIKTLEDHVIVCGFGRVGSQVIQELKEDGITFVVIEKNEQLYEDLENNVLMVLGDATEDHVLVDAGIKKARCIITALPEDADNLLLIMGAKGLNSSIFVVSRAERIENEPKLVRAGADRIVNSSVIGGKKLALSAIKPHTSKYIDSVFHSGTQDYCVEEIFVQHESWLTKKGIADNKIRDRFGVNIVAINRRNEIINNPDPYEPLEIGDILIVFGDRESLDRFSEEVV